MLPENQAILTDLDTMSDPQLAAVYTRGGTQTEINQALAAGIEYITSDGDGLAYDINSWDPMQLADPDKSGHAKGNDDHGKAIGVFYDLNGTHPEEVEHLIRAVKENGIDDIVIPTLTELSPSYRDTYDTIETLTGHGVTVHVLDPGLTITADSAELSTLKAVADAERDDARTAARRRLEPCQTDHTGRPPIGFTASEGKLRPDDDYDDVCTALVKVDEGEMSVYEASEVIEYSRSAISSALEERRDLYRLDEV